MPFTFCAAIAAASLSIAQTSPSHSPAATSTPATNEPAPKPIAAVLYATRGDNKIHVLAADDLRLLKSIDAGLGAHELAVDATGRFAMGSAYGGPGQGHQPADKRLVVIDLPKALVHRTITLEGADRPNDIAFIAPTHNAGNSFEAWVTAEVPQQVLRVNVDTGNVTRHAIDGMAGHMLALAPDAKSVYLAHVIPGTVNFIDAQAGTVSKSVTVPLGAEGIAIAPDGATLWVASNRSNKVSIIDTKEAKVTTTLDRSGFPFRLRFSPDGKWVAISCPQTQDIALYDAKNPKTVHRIDPNKYEDKPLADQMVPTALAFSPDGTSLYALCSGDKPAIVAIDVAKRQVRGYTRCHGPIEDALAVATIQWAGAGA
jgi:YVTN family beta-propeller protein